MNDEPEPTEPNTPAHPNLIDIDGEIEWVDRTPPGEDPAIAQAWAEFAQIYPTIAAELFDDDPDLTYHIAPRSDDAC
ncbi:hypothetical protein [Candidatus Poriferisodalis sp.]|uniref:hypothetical protein n=1 Tax=Candidatus Poriferisodalis sp. TaxID=3101277 RepID=UPI003B0256E6